MTESQVKVIKKALLDVELIEIKNLEKYPTIDFELSAKYSKQVNELIRLEQKRESSFLKLSVRKKVTLLVASVLILLFVLTACLFGGQIKEFVIEIYDSMTRLFSPSDDSLSDFTEYDFSYIPDKYALVDETKYPGYFSKNYSNGLHTLIITQNIASGNSIQIDTEDASYDTINIDDRTLHRVKKNNTYTIVWKNETNAFSLSCHDSLPWEEIEKIILNAVPKE